MSKHQDHAHPTVVPSDPPSHLH
uniref:AP-2 complex subunit alpha-2 n=1 Tax=Rhizophora mucronata TaxID=61149 RepID=A0A2P2MSW1_RHIMU